MRILYNIQLFHILYVILALKYKLDICFCLVLSVTRSLIGLNLSYNNIFLKFHHISEKIAVTLYAQLKLDQLDSKHVQNNLIR